MTVLYDIILTSGFVLAVSKEEKEDILKDVNWVTGTATDQSATYRSELSGIAGILATVAIVVKQFGIVT